MIVTGDLNLAGDLFVSLFDGFALNSNQSFLFGDIRGNLLGQFNGLGEGSLVGKFGGQDLFITYLAGDGNDLALFTAVPEPAAGLMFCAFVLAGIVAHARFRISN